MGLALFLDHSLQFQCSSQGFHLVEEAHSVQMTLLQISIRSLEEASSVWVKELIRSELFLKEVPSPDKEEALEWSKSSKEGDIF